MQGSQVKRAALSAGDIGDPYRLLVDAITDYAIYMLDAEGNVVSWNPGAQRFKGYTADEIIGTHFSQFWLEEDRALGKPQQALAVAAREGRFESESWRVRKDGTRFWAHVVLDPIRDSNGNVIGYAKITRDLTERKEAQRALEEAQQALFQSQKMDTIGRLTGGIAHDFNNLLMVILGSLNLMRKRLPDDAKVLRLLDNAMQGAQRGAALTQRMLAFARRQSLNPQSTDLVMLVLGMTDLLQRSLGPTVGIETRFPPKLDSVMVDSNQLELALLNLTMNARDAMPQGGPIVIAAREETVAPNDQRAGALAPGRYACLSVTDAGEGMDASTLSRAMEPFFTTKGIGKGTGLGLSMVHGLAEQSGGQLLLRSQPKEGTVAELWLPIATDAQTAAQTQDTVPQVPSTMRKLNVLAVDDDRLVLFSTVAMLEDLGHSALEATSGPQALDILRRDAGSIDLVLTDQAMPQMTGLQLADSIRAEWPQMPVVLATGYAELPEGVLLPKLSKPFFQDDLARAIRDAMDRAKRAG